MATRVIALQCPNCLANLEIGAGRNVVCPYCGTSLQVVENDGAVHVHTHIHDEAELRRIEIEEERRRQEKAESEGRARPDREEGECKDLEWQQGSVSTIEDERLAYRKRWFIGIIAWLAVLFLSEPLSHLIYPLTDAADISFVVCPVALYVLRPGAYVPGEEARTWRRNALIYFGGILVFAFFDFLDLFGSLSFLWVVAGAVYLFCTRPSRP